MLDATMFVDQPCSGPRLFGVVLPSQFFPPLRKQRPEQRLMIAVLFDAFDCIKLYRFSTRDEEQRQFHDAKRWFLTEEKSWPYSFESICGVLDLDPNAVRERLRFSSKPPESITRGVS